jgi:hypothetical protein
MWQQTFWLGLNLREGRRNRDILIFLMRDFSVCS